MQNYHLKARFNRTGASIIDKHRLEGWGEQKNEKIWRMCALWLSTFRLKVYHISRIRSADDFLIYYNMSFNPENSNKDEVSKQIYSFSAIALVPLKLLAALTALASVLKMLFYACITLDSAHIRKMKTLK